MAIRPGSFFSGLTTLVVLAVPVLAGFGYREFVQVYLSGQFSVLCGYGLLALLALLGYRYFKVRVQVGSLDFEAGNHNTYPCIEEE